MKSASDTQGRPQRADAQRNRERILRAAETILAKKGSGVGVDDIAAEAGLGVGTLYRHFPTKEALYQAIVVDRMRRLATVAQLELAEGDPAQGLFHFLAHLVEEARVKRDLADELVKWVDPLSPPEGELLDVVNDLLHLTSQLLVAAQTAGAVRSDVGTADLLGLVLGPCVATANPFMAGGSPQVMLDVVCAGLRPEPFTD